MLDSGTLWHQVVQVTQRAIANGSLCPIATRPLTVSDGGVGFLVRVAECLNRKVDAQGACLGPRPDPFLPCDPELVVADLTPSHLGVLNKFNVVEHHLLIVTRDYEPQELPLTLADFQAAWWVQRDHSCLVFYNSGPEAGASQSHRHLQAVPLPMCSTGSSVPIEARFRSVLLAPQERADAIEETDLPFRHALVRWPAGLAAQPESAAEYAHAQYCRALQHLGLNRSGRGAIPGSLPAYNLLLTREWMLVIPRRAEHWETVSVNALGFAGALLVKNSAELEAVRCCGPLSVLAAVSEPAGGLA